MEKRIVIKDIDKFIDIMTQIKGGTFTTLCYVNSAKIPKTLTGKNIDIDKFGSDVENYMGHDTESYGKMRDYYTGGASRKNKFPYAGVMKMTVYQFNWQTEDNYSRKSSEFKKYQDELLRSYHPDATITRREGDHTERMNYGSGVAFGNTDNTMGRVYTHQNRRNAKRLKEDWYLVGDDGNLLEPIDKRALRSLISYSDPEGAATLRKLGVQEEKVKEYIKKIQEYGFDYMKLIFQSVLFVRTTFNGETILYLNDHLLESLPGGLKIDHASVLRKRNELIGLTESMARNRRRVVKLTESDLHRIIRESVSRILSESEIPYTHYANYGDYSPNDRKAYIDAINTVDNNGQFSKWLERNKDLEPLIADEHFSDAERYVNQVKADDKRYGVKPSTCKGYKDRYPDENFNAINANGRHAMAALGQGGRFRGLQAIRMGNNMNMDDAMREYDKIKK